ncbi:MAG: hypothetical protein HY727_17235 [Candidatus Rokubacteria bacterium]|nr:hypothetical protein [Candidatus Rokubacteria bacterium]
MRRLTRLWTTRLGERAVVHLQNQVRETIGELVTEAIRCYLASSLKLPGARTSSSLRG